MRKFITLLLLISIVFVINGCKKSEEKDNGNGGEVNYKEEYNDAIQYLKEIYKSTFINGEINEKTIENGKKYEKKWENIADNFKDNPPGKYADDEEWGVWIDKMIAGAEELNQEISNNDVQTTKQQIRDIQQLILELDERNNDISAIDEIIQFDIYVDETMEAFENKDGDKLKRLFTKMDNSLSRLFTTVTPDTARDNEDEFNTMKNDLYDRFGDFEQAPNREKRLENLKQLKKTSNEFYYKFG
jgi:hypothetical protein